MRREFYFLSFLLLSAVGIGGYLWHPILFFYVFLLPLFLLGVADTLQKSHTIKRNFPIIGHFRYWLEMIRPEIQQYFIETDEDGTPFSRELRSVAYQRAKRVNDTIAFGTLNNTRAVGYEWIKHSLRPVEPPAEPPRVVVGDGQCRQPYHAALLNVSAMSYGALSQNAILALNRGAALGGFAHNTGEGGISPYHLKHGGDLVWQVGTGYFGCRTPDGEFSIDRFRERANLPNVKMIELKLSQGAKPGHGGILPGIKVNREVAEIRDVPLGKDVISPPGHSAFQTPEGLLEFLARMREASGGKPVGFKLCVGKRREFFAICKAMVKTGMYPDFITVDGGEGGTGAAPLEFADSIGTPLNDGLNFVNTALVGVGFRKKIRVFASGKIITGFHMAQKLALGADICNSARGMMFALGCIQALRCNTNRCPTGVATQDRHLTRGLDPLDKAERVRAFQDGTVKSFLHVISAAGIAHPADIRPWHIERRVSDYEIMHYGRLYPTLEEGQLLSGQVPEAFAMAWDHSRAETF